jgi:hypothetical protein
MEIEGVELSMDVLGKIADGAVSVLQRTRSSGQNRQSISRAGPDAAKVGAVEREEPVHLRLQGRLYDEGVVDRAAGQAQVRHPIQDGVMVTGSQTDDPGFGTDVLSNDPTGHPPRDAGPDRQAREDSADLGQ